MKNNEIPRAYNHGIRDINLIAGCVCARAGFEYMDETRLCGSEMSHFSRDSLVRGRDFAFFTGPRNNPESLTKPQDSYRGKNPVEGCNLQFTAHGKKATLK